MGLCNRNVAKPKKTQQPRCEDFPFKQKTEIQKAMSLASRASAWNSRVAALQRAFDVATKYEDMYGDEPSNQASVKLIVEELLEHTLNGAPTPPATPNRLRKANKDIICLCDSGSNDDIRQQNKKPAASSKKSSKKSSNLDDQNNQDDQNKDNEDAQDQGTGNKEDSSEDDELY